MRRGLPRRRLLRRRDSPPTGPFTGRDAQRAVERDGWKAERVPPNDEVWVYCHPAKPGRRVPINPDWQAFYKDDSIFRCIQDDMGVSAHRLLELLSDHNR